MQLLEFDVPIGHICHNEILHFIVMILENPFI